MAAQRTASGLGFAITARDDARMTFSFRVSGPTTTWPGQEMTAAVHPQGDASRIVVGGNRLVGYRPQMGAWHQAKALGLMFLDRLKIVLPEVPESAPEIPARPTAADQLQSLADLRDQGLLTEDEFELAKKQVLS